MADLMQLVTSLAWLVLCVLVARRMRYWDKKFDELYAELKETIGEIDDG